MGLSDSNLFVEQFISVPAALSGQDTIAEYTTSGALVNPTLISGLSNPDGIDFFGSDLFVANNASGTIGEYTTLGAVIDTSLISGLGHPHNIAVFESDLFVTNPDDGTIREYTTLGSPVNAPLISGLNDPFGIAVTAPEPSTLALLAAAGAICLAGHFLRRRNRAT